jgi:hypothetical protein
LTGEGNVECGLSEIAAASAEVVLRIADGRKNVI